MQGPNLPAQVHRVFAPSRALASAALALAVLVWLGPLSSEAVTPVDRSPAATIPCLNKSGTVYKARVSPKRCAHFGRDGAFAGGVDLKSLVWESWGKSKAHGAGIECGFDADCAVIPVSVLAYRLRVRCGRRVYTRVRARSTFGTTLVKTRGCLGPA